MSRPTRVTISIAALQHNLQRVREFAPNAKIMAMVKSNGYGHGLSQSVEALSQADRFGVCSLEEALQVRSVSKNDVMLMEGFFTLDELPIIAERDFILTLHSLEQISKFITFKSQHRFRICLKINTGMNRLGVAPNEVQTAMQQLSACEHVSKPIEMMTHCANADEVHDPTTQNQAQLFAELTQGMIGARSIGNSAVIMAWPAITADWVRPGLMMYGISPFANTSGIDYGLKPAMTVTSEIIALRQCHAGDRIGYGGTYVCDKSMTIGVVAIGYGDGYPKHLPNGTPVLVAGVQVPLVGRVSMDMITVDCSAVPQLTVGSPVTLWGEGLPVERIAEAAGTIPYELVCCITQRVQRNYL